MNKEQAIARTQRAEVTHHGVLDLQVCVPSDWDDNQIVQFANAAMECGTRAGWVIRREGDPALSGDPEKVPCLDDIREGFVHVMLDA